MSDPNQPHRRPTQSDVPQGADTEDVTQELSTDGTETAELGETHDMDNAAQRDARIPRDLPTIPGYVTDGLIAAGGMGFVIRAHDEVLQRTVAIKLPLRSSMEDRKQRTRFFREARAAAGLQHPNICPIFEVGESNDRPYLVMGYIEGLQVDEWVAKEAPNNRQIADVVASLARAVHYAHQHDVLHRDIKPSNVMLDHESQQPFLMDFGLAKETTAKDSIETQDGQVLGTPSFMAPEQARGEINAIDHATDTYSLGALLYALLCGRPPFTGSLTNVLMQVQTEEPATVRSISPQVHRDLETVCQKAMSKAPSLRYASALEFAEDLDRFSAGEPIRARRLGLAQRLAHHAARRPVAWLSGAGAVLLCIVSIVLIQWSMAAADRASHDRQLTQLTTRLKEATSAPRFSISQLADVDGLAERVSAMDYESGLRWKQRIDRWIGDCIEAALEQPRMQESQIEEVRTWIAILAERRPVSEDSLERQLQSRIARWETAFQYVAPDELRQGLSDQVQLAPGGVSSDRTSPIPTSLPGSIRNEVEAVFGPWQESTGVGVALNLAQKKLGYLVMFRPVDAVNEMEPNSSSESPHFTRRWELAVLRDGTTLKRWPVAPWPDGERLTLRARREGNQLQVWVNGEQSFDCRDLFPREDRPLGVYGVILSPTASLQRLVGKERRLPLEPSAFERANQLYLEGAFSEAATAFATIDATSLSPEQQQEANAKRGLCLLQAGREKEAERLLTQAALSETQPWSILAVGQLWKHAIDRKDAARSEQLLSFVEQTYEAADIAAALPDQLRTALVDEYSVGVANAEIRHNPQIIGQLELAARVQEALGTLDRNITQQKLLQAYVGLGRFEDAEALGKQFAAIRLGVAQEYMQALLCQGKLDAAWSQWSEYEHDSTDPSWQITNAKLLANLGRHGEAWESAHGAGEALVELGIRQHLHIYYRAALIEGLTLHRLGYPERALEVWRSRFKAAEKDYWTFKERQQKRVVSVKEFYGFLLASLCGELKTRHVSVLREGFGGEYSDLIRKILKDEEIATSIAAGWQSPEGLASASRIILDQATAPQGLIAFGQAAAFGYFSQRLGPNHSLRQRRHLWELSGELADQIYYRKVSLSQMMLLGAAWKGQLGVLGWSSVAGGFRPKVRADMAYLLGRKALFEGKSDIARQLLEESRRAAESSLGGTLAVADLVSLERSWGQLDVQNETGVSVELGLRSPRDEITMVKIPSGESTFPMPPGAWKIEAPAGLAVHTTNNLEIQAHAHHQIRIENAPWREAAKTFMELGAAVTIIDSEGRQRLLKPGELPIEAATALDSIVCNSRLPIGDSTLEVLRDVGSLRLLRLRGDRLTHWGLQHLTGCRELETLQVFEEVVIDEAVVKQLNQLRGLRVLELLKPMFAGGRLEQLRLPLRKLAIRTDAFTESVANNLAPTLRALSLTGNEVSDLDLRMLKQLPHLTQLRINHMVAPDTLSQLPPRLLHLVLSSFPVGKDHIEALSHIPRLRLSVNTALTPAVVDAVVQRSNIHRLDLDHRASR